jgi:hypothetical protein
MDIDINYQKIIKKLKIKLFKSERYFEYFKSFLISLIIPPEDSIKKIKVYNLINSKHSIQKKPPKKFWYCIYIKMVNSSNEFPNNISMLEEKYLQYYSLYIYKYLCSISEIYSADINLLKQEYLNLCIKFVNHTKNKRLKTLRIASNSSDSNNKNNNNISKEKSSEDDEDNEKNIKKYGDKKPKTLIEKELFRLKIKSSNEIVDEFIGDINNDLLIKKKKEIFFLHYIKTKKNKTFKRFLSKETRKDLEEIKQNDLIYNKKKDKYDTIFSLEMKIKNQYYRNNNKKKRLNLQLKEKNITINNENNKKNKNSLSQKKNYNINRYYLKKNLKMNFSGEKNKLILTPKNTSNNNALSKYFSFNNKKKSLFLPLLPNEEIKVLKTEKYNSIINKKYYINGNDLFY